MVSNNYKKMINKVYSFILFIFFSNEIYFYFILLEKNKLINYLLFIHFSKELLKNNFFYFFMY